MTVLTRGYDMPAPWHFCHNTLRVGPGLVVVVGRMYYPVGQPNNGAVRFDGTLFRLGILPGEHIGHAIAVGDICDQPLHNMN